MTQETSESVSTAFNFMTNLEVEGLKKCVNLLDDKPWVINVGAGVGTSGLAILEARPDSLLITVDQRCEPEGSPLGGLGNERQLLERVRISKARYTQLCGDSVHVARTVLKRSATKHDMVFIDAGHEYDECYRDIKAYLPLIVPNGIIALHDYGADFWPGVQKAVDELLKDRLFVLHYDTFIAFRNVAK